MKPLTRISTPRFVLFVYFVMLCSCVQEMKFDGDENAKIKSSQQLFNYESNTTMSLNLNLKNIDGNPASGIVVKVYTENPFGKIGLKLNPKVLPNTKGNTDSNGNFSVKMAVPDHIDSLYIVVDNLLFNKFYTVAKSNNFSSTIYPSGYGILKQSAVARNAVSAPIPYTRITASIPANSQYYVLGAYNATTGYPNYTDTPEPASVQLAARVDANLPEGFDQFSEPSKTQKGYFQNVNETNIEVIDNAYIWLTFVTEGAGVNNTVGYFYYPTNSPPANKAAISKKIIIFPNSSNSVNDGGFGTLTNGTKVKLRYQDPISGDWSDIFPAGVTVSWFLVTSGWGGSTYDYFFANRAKTQFSIYNFNAGSSPQTVILFDVVTQKIVLGFEDISIGEYPNGSYSSGTEPSDKDFNDVVCLITATPITAVNTYPLKRIVTPTDTDGDGVPNVSDDYPNDPERAFNNYYPSASIFGSLAFEDNWPSKGDYDFNDLVLDYQIKYVTNASNKIKDVIPTIRVRAIGAVYRNGFAIEMNAAPSNIESIVTTSSSIYSFSNNTVFDLNIKGYENGQSKLVVPFFDNAYTLFGSASIPGFVNTYPNMPYYQPVEITKKITFNFPVEVSTLGTAPYNPFIVVNQRRGIEVHKAGFAATAKANTSLFNTNDDLTNQTTRWYVGTQSYPWAIDIPTTFSYPIEQSIISSAYLKLDQWISSNGSNFSDWYSNTNAGYRNNAKIY